MEVKAAVCAVLLCGLFVCTLGETHSLCYLYTVQSKSSPGRGHGFSVVTLLDDEQIDSYNSISTDTGGTRTPKQDWVKKMKENEWEAGTYKLIHDGRWLKDVLNIQMEAFRQRESDGHTLQGRIGCEGGERSDGSGSVINYINEYGYDGEDFISYNWTLKKWTASVSQAKKVEEEWNGGKGQNPDQKRDECETWLKIYLPYKPPDIRLYVHVFVKKSETSSDKLTLTCLATGFYPKDVVVSLRKCSSSLSEHLLTSSGVRPNEDGTYQLRKSVEIQQDHPADYDCYVTHSSLTESIITKLGGESSNCQSGGVNVGVNVDVILVVMAVLFLLTVLVLVTAVIICRRKRISGSFRPKNLTVLETTPISVRVQWDKPLGEIDRYILSSSCSHEGDKALRRWIEVKSGAFSANINLLKPGSVYIISLVAEKSRIQSQPVTVHAATRICKPRNLRVVKTSPTSVKVRWEKAQGEIDTYILSVSPSQTDGSVVSQQIEVPSGEDSAVIDDLEPGSVYNISLEAKKGRIQSRPVTVKAATRSCPDKADGPDTADCFDSDSDSDSGSCPVKADGPDTADCFDSDSDSDSGSRSAESLHCLMENVETCPMIEGTTTDPDTVVNDPPKEEKQRLLSLAAALLQDR